MPGNVRNTGQNDSHRTPITSAARTKSLDCLADKSDKTSEYVPSRITRTQPKIKSDAMQFVKTGPAGLYKSATEQIKKAEAVKAMRKHLIAEEEDWQQNLDKWKSSRRKRNEDALERVIEIKKNEQEEELNRTRRKSKTFSEMQEEKNKRGRRYNLVVHDDDNNDLADLGLSTVKSSGSLYDGQEDNDVKDLDQDNKDAKSDAGFCTGSDTGSDGVFAEDNISDTSSALGDKKETHDSLLDTGVSKEEEPRINGHGSSLTSDILNTNNANLYTEEYTYDKAIEGYKQYAENTAKKRTSSITSLNSNTSFTKEDERKDERPRLNGRSPSPAKSNKLEEKLNFFTKEMVKESRTSPEPRVIMREKSPKVDVGKRRSMFEMGEPLISQSEREQKQANRRSLEVPGSLRNKVASFENLDMDTPKVRGMTPNIETNLKSKVKSFENLDTETTKVRGVTPTRDTKFREKLASFAAADTESQTVRKKTPERDVNFHKKLASFTSIENGEEEKCVERKTIPLRDPTLKNKIASFEQLEQAAEAYSQPPREEPMKNRDRSISLENLDEPPPVKEVMRPAVSMGNMGLMRRAPSTPYMVVDLDKTGVEEESCIREKRPVVSDEQESAGARDQAKRSTIYETIEKCQVVRDVESAPMFSIFQYLSPEVGEEIQGEIEEPINEPHYQTLEEVREEVSASVEPAPAPLSPPQQVAPKPPPVIEPPEVLDVTWTDGPSQAAPPCVPPPPPPPDDDSDDDASDQPQGLPEQAEDEPFTRENSTRRIKKELWRRRSDFLGTSSQYIEEEPTVKPPPDLSELLRQEREAERIMAESQRARTPIQETLSKAEIARREKEIIESLERSEQLKQQQQQQQQSQYTWQDHMAEETTMTEEQKQLSEHLEYQVLMSVDRDSCSQGFNSVPPPPPSPVANPTHPCSSLAACMPSHSDLFTLSPLPEGDEVSGSASPHRGICSSPPPLPIAPPECGVPSLTPIPEGEEMATPSTTISEKSTPTSDVVTPSPSSPLPKISACASAKSTSPESVPCIDSPCTMSPELTVTPSQDIAPISSSAPTVHVSTNESVDQTAPTLSSVSDPIYTSYSSVTSTTYSLVDPNLQTDVNIQQPSESSPSVDEKERADVLQHSDSVSCDSIIANDTFESVLEASSSEPCSTSPQSVANSTISHAHPDAEPSPSSPNSDLNSPGLLDPSGKPTAPDTQHITEPVNSDSQIVSSVPTVSALQSETKYEKSSKEKTVRFNIDDECKLCDQSISDSSDDSLPLPSELDSDASIDSKETADTVITDTQIKCEEHVENHSNITSSTLSPSQAQTESTSSESDIDIQVATNVPVTSANIPTTSQSVMDSKELETMETSSQSPDETFEALPISSKDTVDSVETKAEMLETHVIEPNTTVAKVLPTQTQMEVEAENNVQPESSQQYTDLLESHYSTLDYSSDSVASTGSHPDPYKKLAELEEEMMRHDQDMLQRAGKLAPASTISNDAQPAHIPPPTMYASQEGAPVPSPQAPQTAENNNYSNYQPPAPQLPIQEFYTAPTYEPTPPSSLAPAEGLASPGQKAVSPPAGSPSQYSTLASPHPFTRSHSQSSIGAPPIHPPLQGIRSSPTGSPRDPAPEPLPRKKKLPPPPPSKPHQIPGDSTERSEAIRLSRMPTSNPNSVSPQPQEIQGEAVSPSGQQMSKQTLLALSAIPKPRLTDNESWITKKKPESQRRDYSKHWLHQEAEQRRLEQQDRVNRQQQARAPAPKTLPPQSVSPQQPPHPQTTSYLPTYPPQNASPTYSSYPQALKNPSPIQSNNNNNNNMWRNQATTYQPHMPTQAPNGDKALPDSIIHNITQRVNNKNSKNTYSNTNGRLGNTYGNNNYRDENYHDYMNADALSAPSTHTPLYQSGMGPSQQPPFNSQSQDHSSGQDQRLLSVSGKKKCSHCSEELGRGAAMIIESLRLFYHIPCFKCCVCGIQLGNGSAGADVRVRNHKLHCHNCYSNDEGMKFSKV